VIIKGLKENSQINEFNNNIEDLNNKFKTYIKEVDNKFKVDLSDANHQKIFNYMKKLIYSSDLKIINFNYTTTVHKFVEKIFECNQNADSEMALTSEEKKQDTTLKSSDILLSINEMYNNYIKKAKNSIETIKQYEVTTELYRIIYFRSYLRDNNYSNNYSNNYIGNFFKFKKNSLIHFIHGTYEDNSFIESDVKSEILLGHSYDIQEEQLTPVEKNNQMIKMKDNKYYRLATNPFLKQYNIFNKNSEHFFNEYEKEIEDKKNKENEENEENENVSLPEYKKRDIKIVGLSCG